MKSELILQALKFAQNNKFKLKNGYIKLRQKVVIIFDLSPNFLSSWHSARYYRCEVSKFSIVLKFRSAKVALD
jgi:hypothetical protein